MKRITSKSNAFYKTLTRISKLRDHSSFLLEGIHLCAALLDQNLTPECVVVSQSATESPEICEILQKCKSCAVYQLADSLFRSISSVPSPQGVLLVVRADQFYTEMDFDQSCILLDRVQDPGNLGTIIRTSAAAGIRHVILSNGTVNAWSQKVLRSAQGAHFSISIHENADLPALISRFSLPVYACALGDGQTSLYDQELSMPAVWIFGNEGQGISADLLNLADRRVMIPQTDLVESLNVAAAAAVTLFEQRRRLFMRGVSGT